METGNDATVTQRISLERLAATQTRQASATPVQLLSSPTSSEAEDLIVAARARAQSDSRFSAQGKAMPLYAYDADTPAPSSTLPAIVQTQDLTLSEAITHVDGILRGLVGRRAYAQALSRDARALLEWLSGFDGSTWEERWIASGADMAPRGFEKRPALAGHQVTVPATIQGAWTLIAARMIRPSYSWLLNAGNLSACYARFWQLNDPDGLAALRALPAYGRSIPLQQINAEIGLLRVMVRTGKSLLDVRGEELLHYADVVRTSGRSRREHLAWELMVDLGPFVDEPATLRAAWSASGNSRQHSVAALVDRYQVGASGVRDLLVDYLTELKHDMDYSSLEGLAHRLARLFWWQVLQINSEQKDLRLSPDTANRWVEELHRNLDGSPRREIHSVMFAIRALYRDLAEWSHDDPVRWGVWVAPCPVPKSMSRAAAKEKRHRQARMHARTRSLVPLLPTLVAAAEERKANGERMLAAAVATANGDQFTVDGVTLQRAARRPRARAEQQAAIWVTVVAGEDPRHPLSRERGRVNVTRLEADGFWAWAVVNVLRHTGIRIEELSELTQLSLRHHTAASTGTLVPLLHIVPSKNDRERLIPMSPELVTVLVEVLRRAKGGEPNVPLSVRYDPYEKVHSAPFPHLFARRVGTRQEVISMAVIRRLLNDLASAAELTDAGEPIAFTPHDFRRLFSTEMVGAGLPLHIVGTLLGHLNLDTTRGYTAVFPEQVIAAHQAFTERRRGLRPEGEMRPATETEWDEFEDHFTRRRVALGDCHRPYGTPCVHEHACTRCRFLRVDPTQLGRLEDMTSNAEVRLEEAKGRVWLGEVAALEEQLVHLRLRRNKAEQQLNDKETSNLADASARTGD